MNRQHEFFTTVLEAFKKKKKDILIPKYQGFRRKGVSKDCNAALDVEASRNPLVKGEGIVCLMFPLLRYYLKVIVWCHQRNIVFCPARGVNLHVTISEVA